MMSKTRVGVLVALALFILAGNVQVWALKPVVDRTAKTLRLLVEHVDDGLRTYYTAVVVGAETWLARYYTPIIKHCTTTTAVYANLPGYGYTRVSSSKLAQMLFNDAELAKRGYTTALRDKLIRAMDDDRRYGRAKSVGEYWDPASDWQWRYKYMINRMTTANPGTSNCFGTTSYMTKGHEWILAYQEMSNQFNTAFPAIMLAGIADEGYAWYFDRPLRGALFGYAGTANPGTYVGYYLNAFDIIRFAQTGTGYTDLIITVNGQPLNLGSASHAVVYLCTDRAGNAWIFEKPEMTKPWNVRTLPDSYYSIYSLVTLFYHKSYAKDVLSGITGEDWAGVITQ